MPTLSYHTNLDSWVDGEELLVEGAFLNDSTRNGWRGRPQGAGDQGSKWTAIKSFIDISPVKVSVICSPWWANTHKYGYRGPLLINDDPYLDPSVFNLMRGGASSELALQAFGTTAIARVKPTNPIVDIPLAIGELLTEGLPAMLGSRIARGGHISPSNIADEYLNGVFGLLPFWNDMQDFSHAVNNANRIIAKYVEQSGKPIRRKYHPDIVTTTETQSYNNDSGYEQYLAGLQHSSAGNFLTPAYGGHGGVREDVTTADKDQWFSGAFTYYLPSIGMDGNKLARDLAKAKKLYGGIGASTVWNLLPFSWAADWFSNAGDVISNIDSFSQDGLVMLWGYTMEKYSVVQRRTVRGATLGNLVEGSNLPGVITTQIGVDYMRRRKATPFGFGLDESELSARQWSILGALGIQGRLH